MVNMQEKEKVHLENSIVLNSMALQILFQNNQIKIKMMKFNTISQ